MMCQFFLGRKVTIKREQYKMKILIFLFYCRAQVTYSKLRQASDERLTVIAIVERK